MSDVLEIIERLQDAGLHEIVFRNAGVGFVFYEGPLDPVPDDWRRHLSVKGYHPTFEQALDVEAIRLGLTA